MSLLIWTWWTNQITVLTVQREPGLLTSTLVPFVTCDLTKQSTRQHGDALFEKTVLAHPWLMLDASCYLYLNGSAEDQHQTTRIHSSKSNMDSRSPFPSTLLFVLLLVLPVFANASSRVSHFLLQGNAISIFVARKLLILILGNLFFINLIFSSTSFTWGRRSTMIHLWWLHRTMMLLLLFLGGISGSSSEFCIFDKKRNSG